MTTGQLKTRIREYVATQGFVEFTIVDEDGKVSTQKYTNVDEALAAFDDESISNTVYV